jgi:hypothetical protein
MEKLKFETLIDASREVVWDVLWSDSTYPLWTSSFGEGGKAVSDWQQGSKIYFLSASDDGMLSLIETKIPNEYMAFRHMGMVSHGVEDAEGEEAKKWAGSLEDYRLTTKGDKTELAVGIDILPEYKSDFLSMWPAAMARIKSLAEERA